MRLDIRRGRSTEIPKRNWRERIFAVSGRFLPLLAFVLAFGLMRKETWNGLADLADNDTWRPVVVASLAAIAVLLWPWYKKLSSGAVAIAAAAATILGVVFILLPNLKPPTISSYEFKNFAVEHGVTLGAYSEHYPVKSLLAEGGWRFPAENDPALSVPGTVVVFDSEVKGRADEEIGLSWALFDAKTKKRLADSGDIDPLCRYRQAPIEGNECLRRKPRRQDSDVACF